MVEIKCTRWTPMDTWTNLDRLMKIKWWTSSDPSSSHVMWKNLGASSSIKQTQFNDNNSRIYVQSELLIEDEVTHPTVAAKFLYNLTSSSIENFVLGCFEQIELCRQLCPRIT